MIKKFGSEAAWKAWMRENGRKGGVKPTTGGFAGDNDLAKRAGRIGGTISRRGKSKRG